MEKKSIQTKHGEIALPAFLPDATYGSIRTASFNDVKNAGINEIVSTTLHLEQKIGSQYIKKMGGLHKFINWDRPILTDSGGWQVFSLINSNKGNKQNRITDLGCSFIDPASGDYSLLTPEGSIVIQSNLGADILTVLDDPIIGDASLSARKESVELTTKWAARSKKKFDEIYKDGEDRDPHRLNRPLLGAVVQGADDKKMRKESAEQLLELDFDLYNFGGIPMYSDISWKKDFPTGFYREMLAYVSELIPDNKYKYAMGVGQPEDIAYCVDAGWDIFDTVLPTRNARHGYLYVGGGMGDESKSYSRRRGSLSSPTQKVLSYDIMHLRSERYKFDENPVDENCDCECCKTVSRAYLRHLIRIKEPAGQRLCTIHNLAFYAKWMEELRVTNKN
ncbi:tRNA guanosine(34) transglycosylase Tgt [Candidatus Dojkabacteria bacterium]|uniref:tRNA guanosine(34) transglycosylase Tgt n=1 Tax=Candidatus Dojkabacteria bacterium TaxID=2099670 RepID=A0A955LAT4_9BACT|nr:tRNA guanosine(34) transglycosylase Tgt [Candidatus Dojkabacteria bacterium]